MGTLSRLAVPKASPEPLDLSAAYRCTNCGISFSSPRNLAAHSAYYCTQRLQRAQTPQENTTAATTTGSPSPVVVMTPNTGRHNGTGENAIPGIKSSTVGKTRSLLPEGWPMAFDSFSGHGTDTDVRDVVFSAIFSPAAGVPRESSGWMPRHPFAPTDSDTDPTLSCRLSNLTSLCPLPPG
ncbi:hypothetical protein BIW11_12443 [Tropilaelaps mercedesae]|uniref:C2H2-type domain-containing protein n=1 Tax=Tropilaelaps mercedesae TaxID=418985 RepID=A0A1V9X6C3_9ACAR|nr:hypothetical protein BIW11_12443 [Tropilaelaps mercedesae]